MPLFFIYLGVPALSAHYPRTRRRAIRSNFAAQILRTKKQSKCTIIIYLQLIMRRS